MSPFESDPMLEAADKHNSEIHRLESKLAAAKAEIAGYECGLCPTKTDLTVGHMFCVNCVDKLESENKHLRAALESILSDKHNIGNDWSGNLKGYPDAVMCRSIANAALDGGKGD